MRGTRDFCVLKETVMKRARLLVYLMMVILLILPETYAQSTAPPGSSEGWQFQVIPYLWGSSFEGRVGIGDRSADVDASFRDILRELNFAYMGAFQASRDRFVTLADVIYLNLSDERATPGPLFSGVDAFQRTLIFQPAAGYRIVGSEAAFVDVLGGIRFWHVNGELRFATGLLPGVDIEGNRNWVDGIFGLRGRVRLSPAWSINGYGDIGGGGSNMTYQILGTARAELGKHFAIVFGYRHLKVNYNKDAFLFDNAMSGPALGFAFKF
jgi:hypothetical protein